MNILKIGLVLLTGAGFGLGFNRLPDSEVNTSDQNRRFGHMYEEENYEGYCHRNGDFLEHMLENLSDEDANIVQEKIDDLLLEYGITFEELNDDFGMRLDFMNDLMEFLEEKDISYYGHGNFYDRGEDDEWYPGMGMH